MSDVLDLDSRAGVDAARAKLLALDGRLAAVSKPRPTVGAAPQVGLAESPDLPGKFINSSGARIGLDLDARRKVRPVTPDDWPDPQAQHNVRLAIARSGVRLAFNDFTSRVHVHWRGEKDVLNDAIDNALWLLMERLFFFRTSRELLRGVLEDLARLHRFHPVLDYLNAVGPWDLVPRIDKWLVDYGGAEDSPYVRAVSPLPFLGGVGRVRRPGSKFDEMVVIEGRQGIRKSSLLRALCPDSDWFSDCLTLSSSPKEVIEQTEGRWIIEIPELSGMSGAQIEKLKAMLSRQVDSARLAYGHHRVDKPRQFILFGTTNDSEYLRDMTGNRRFWPVAVKYCDVEGLAAVRDQLWAEAAHRDSAGESARLPESFWQAAGEQQDKRLVDDPWEDEIVRYLNDPALRVGQPANRVSRQELWRWLGHNPGRTNKSDGMRLRQVMERLGWRKMTVTDASGKPVAGYGKD